jgi:hypothetical protein
MEHKLCYAKKQEAHAHGKNIQTSLILVEYTTNRRGIDVINQLQASYNAQIQNHKWWHHIFFFFMDLSVVTINIIYLERVKNLLVSGLPITHLQFKVGLYKSFLIGWKMRNLHPLD